MDIANLAYWQTICEERLQAKKEDTKTIQNLKMLKTRSSNFETVKFCKTKKEKREEINKTKKKLSEINEGPGSSKWLSSLLLIDEGSVLSK